jgi:Putative phage tail protein
VSIDPVSIAIVVALNAATMAITASQTIEGPRLEDLSVTVADYGTPLPNFVGQRRLEAPVFYAEPIKETKRKRKGKGGKYREYTYSGTYAVMVADHEVEGFLRVWLDRRLAYDVDDAGAVSDSLDAQNYMRFYYGTPTQDPDERMLATIEAEEGVGMCPAYLDVSYIFFEELPLEPFGNRFPTTSVEARRTGPVRPEIQWGFDTPYPTPIPTGPRSGGGGNGLFLFLRIQGIQMSLASNPLASFTSAGMGIEYDRGTNTAFSAAGHPITTDADGNVVATMTEVFSTVEGNVTIVSQATFLTDRVRFRMSSQQAIAVLDTPTNAAKNFRSDFSWGAPPPFAPDYAEIVTDADGDVVPYTGPDVPADIINTPTQQSVKIQITGARTLGTEFGPPSNVNQPPTLGDVSNLISQQVGLPVTDYDFSALDQVISGFSWTQGAAKQILEPLYAVYDSLLVPNGFVLEGKKRGGAVTGSPISFENFARTSDTEQAEPYRVEVVSESDLPRRIFMTFADLNGEQQPNTATAQRAGQSVLTVRELSYDLTSLALTAEEAQQLTERALRRPWIGSIRGENKLPPNYLWILPGDVVDFDLDDDTTIRACIKRKTVAPNRTLTLRWEQDRAAVSELGITAGAEAVGRPPPSVFAPRDTALFILDVPLIADVDDQSVPFLYVAATPAAAGDWPGADVYESATGNEDTYAAGFYQFAAAQAAIAGVCSSVVPDALTTVPDYGTQIVVGFFGSTPTIVSATLEELIANPTLNLAAVGRPDRFELLQFMDADLQSDGDWILSGLLRGRRGTERFTGTHEAGDYCVIYSAAWAKRDMGASRLNQTTYYEAITYGLGEAARGAEIDTFTAEALRPLSVANVQVNRDYETGTFDVTWQRRTRLGGSSIDGQDVPLGETSELYNVRVLDGVEIVRSLQVTSPAFEYTVYEQIEDFGVEQPSITVEIEQVSPALNLAGATVQATG